MDGGEHNEVASEVHSLACHMTGTQMGDRAQLTQPKQRNKFVLFSLTPRSFNPTVGFY